MNPARRAGNLSPAGGPRNIVGTVNSKVSWWSLALAGAMGWVVAAATAATGQNMIANGDLEQREGDRPAGFELAGAAEYRYLGDIWREASSYGVVLSATQPAGSVACVVDRLDAKDGKWFRFAFRGLPEDNFAVGQGDLWLKVEFFGGPDRVAYDGKEKKLYDQVLAARRDFSVNGVGRQHGAEVWRDYLVDFCLPFPQVDRLRLSVGFGHGAATNTVGSRFLVDDLSLIRIPEPTNAPAAPAAPLAVVPAGPLLPLGGRWFYAALPGETQPPAVFAHTNADRLVYQDTQYSAPFAGNTTAWLRAGDLDANGREVEKSRWVADNVTIQFTKDSLVLRTHGLPNHPTGRFPEQGFGNPNYITEQVRSFYLPLNPRESPGHLAMTNDNRNGALPMGPIGVAVNGVVFFNPFDMQQQEALDLMDRCCGHPAPNGQYHYHKYPICVNSPWADEGRAHSPLLGWAFDGFPVYGPYEGAGVMAKDVRGKRALNAFNGHEDAERGWHYHATPGKFPYLIGGYWGTRDPRDGRGGPGGRGGAGGPGGRRGPGGAPAGL